MRVCLLKTCFSIYYGEKALALAQRTNDRRAIARASLSLSNPIRKKGENDVSLKYIFSALELFREIEDWSGQSTCLNQIGVNYIYVGDYEKAIGYLKQAIEIDLRENLPKKLMNDYTNIGE